MLLPYANLALIATWCRAAIRPTRRRRCTAQQNTSGSLRPMLPSVALASNFMQSSKRTKCFFFYCGSELCPNPLGRYFGNFHFTQNLLTESRLRSDSRLRKKSTGRLCNFQYLFDAKFQSGTPSIPKAHRFHEQMSPVLPNRSHQETSKPCTRACLEKLAFISPGQRSIPSRAKLALCAPPTHPLLIDRYSRTYPEASSSILIARPESRSRRYRIGRSLCKPRIGSRAAYSRLVRRR